MRSVTGPIFRRSGSTVFTRTDALAAQFCAWAQNPLKRIVLSHGEPITDDPAAILREVAATLT